MYGDHRGLGSANVALFPRIGRRFAKPAHSLNHPASIG